MENIFILPSFDKRLSHLDQFIHTLVDEFQAKAINSWGDLDERVKAFFTPEQMELTCLVVPNWKKMASYRNGVTLTHVMCVFLGLYRMPEFLQMTPEQQQMMKWVILLHDVEKEPQPGIRDHFHAFRSAVGAAKLLPKIGFPVLPEYSSAFDEWYQLTSSAKTTIGEPPMEVQDNKKLPTILEGIERMFGYNTPTALILKTILFHLSVDMNDWPPPNPLTHEEEIRFIDLELLPLLRVMNLGDGEGWSMFDQEVRARQRLDTLQVFQNLEQLLLNRQQRG